MELTTRRSQRDVGRRTATSSHSYTNYLMSVDTISLWSKCHSRACCVNLHISLALTPSGSVVTITCATGFSTKKLCILPIQWMSVPHDTHKKVITSLQSIQWLVFVMETHCDLWYARTETLCIMCTYSITADSNLVPRFYFFSCH
jgi:hypothetical protein